MGNYETLKEFFAGDYLQLRFEKVINNIRAHSRQTSSMLLFHLENNATTISIMERQKVLVFVDALAEVVFVAENLHIYICGLDRTRSSEKVKAQKLIEIKNQGNWLSRHLPALWDAALIYAKFEEGFGKHLVLFEPTQFYFFEASSPLVTEISKQPFSYLKLHQVHETERLTTMLLASTLACTVKEMEKQNISLSSKDLESLGAIQSHVRPGISDLVCSLTKAYEQACFISPMGESDDVLNLIDLLDVAVAHLKREYTTVLEKPNPKPTVANLEKIVTKLHDILAHRLQQGRSKS